MTLSPRLSYHPRRIWGLSTPNPPGWRGTISQRRSWVVRASDLPHHPSCRPSPGRRKNASPSSPSDTYKPDLMERRPDYLGPLGLSSLMVEELATVHPGPRRLAPPARDSAEIRKRGRLSASMTMTAVPQTSVSAAPPDARPPGRLSTVNENGSEHHSGSESFLSVIANRQGQMGVEMHQHLGTVYLWSPNSSDGSEDPATRARDLISGNADRPRSTGLARVRSDAPSLRSPNAAERRPSAAEYAYVDLLAEALR